MGVEIELDDKWFSAGENIADKRSRTYDIYKAKQELKKRLQQLQGITDPAELEDRLAAIRAVFPFQGAPYVRNNTLYVGTKKPTGEAQIGHIRYSSLLPKLMQEEDN